jgi:hypothetical protein
MFHEAAQKDDALFRCAGHPCAAHTAHATLVWRENKPFRECSAAISGLRSCGCWCSAAAVIRVLLGSAALWSQHGLKSTAQRAQAVCHVTVCGRQASNCASFTRCVFVCAAAAGVCVLPTSRASAPLRL